MKQPEYHEGKEALENFKEGMKALFKVPKEKVVLAEKAGKKKPSRAQTLHKPHISDKD